MVKLFMTGDNHFGKKYDRYPEIKELLIQTRFDCLKDMVHQAENEHCDFFVITGDLFDNISSIRRTDVNSVVDILKRFDGRVLVLPGNHDYYTGEEKIWKDFKDALQSVDNIYLLTEMRPLYYDVGDERVTVYPAPCQSKHARTNNLGWIKAEIMNEKDYNIGIAHGAIEGLTPDINGDYFHMTEKELNAIPVDAWLIGHTHIPYPALSEVKDESGYKIFNAGTHAQTDLHNNTQGYGFILTMDKKNGKKTVLARSWKSGKICFFDLNCAVKPEQSLKNALLNTMKDIPENSVIRVRISGAIPSNEYENRAAAYREILSRFLTYELDDSELSEIITPEKIKAEFAEIGFAAKLLEELLPIPKEAQMAYDLLKKYQA